MNKKTTTNSKSQLRNAIASQKKQYSETQLARFSEDALSTLELVAAFQEASVVLIYYSMKDEVDTKMLIGKYSREKTFLLPVVVGQELIVREFCSEQNMTLSSYGIWEPAGNSFVDFDKIDLVVVPGVAFDRNLNRMGRGKGFYDRLLPALKCPKVGLCFDFQLFDRIPADERDAKMNMVVSQNELVIG